MRTSQAGIDLIRKFEGLELESYQDIAGIWTIGYGHTGAEVGPDQRITASEAEALLRHDLGSREKSVSRLTKVDLNQNEFDALVSFIYNVGEGAYSKSTARRRLNGGDRIGAADALTWFNKATVNGVLREVQGLTRRRASEKALFLTPVEIMASRPDNINDSGRITPVEDAPRRESLGDSRTVQGAAVAGGAGTIAANMGRDSANELDEIESQIERGEGLTVPPADPQTDDGTDGGNDGGTATDIPPLDGSDTGTGETGTGDTGTDSTGSTDTDTEPSGEVPVEVPMPPTTEGTGTAVEQPINRPSAHEKHDTDAQIQLALTVIIILSVLFVIYARIDDWFKFRR